MTGKPEQKSGRRSSELLRQTDSHGEDKVMDYDEYPCPFCQAVIKRSSFFCDSCGRDLSRSEPEFGEPPFGKEIDRSLAWRVAIKTSDRSRFMSYVSTFATIAILAGVVWVGVVPFVKEIKQPGTVEVAWLVAAVAVPMLVFAMVILAFAMPSRVKPGTGSSAVPPLNTLLAVSSLALAIYALNAPFWLAAHLLSAACLAALVSLVIGNRVFAITTVVVAVVGFMAIHELQDTAAGSQSIVEQLQHLNLED
jgi:hypothetical protein